MKEQRESSIQTLDHSSSLLVDRPLRSRKPYSGLQPPFEKSAPAFARFDWRDDEEKATRSDGVCVLSSGGVVTGIRGALTYGPTA